MRTAAPIRPVDIAGWGRRVMQAHQRISSWVVETPCEPVTGSIAGGPARLLFKREDLQHTGSFKLRGASNKLLVLTPEERAAGVIAASNGNHGLGVAAGARTLGVSAEVYVSSHVSPAKARKIEEYGAVVRRAGSDPLDAELAGRAAARKAGKAFISPYNDADVMAGQGTIAVELLHQSPSLDAVFVAVGGGGLVGGIGAYLKWISPQTEIVGCWPENSRVLYESIKAGYIVSFPELPTLSESTAGGLEPETITLDVCRTVIDRSVLVTEDEILAAMRLARKTHGWVMEGAAAVALAAFLKQAAAYTGKTVAVVICGGNVSPEVLSRLQ
ncbi:MAG TPA: threonine/serine dehydratase [Verrucomicrobiae bacterium]|jgi:threonine dehydratase|nr:threonine/serine dehydratase [Verrucomicrobiae bacterium]